MFINMLIIGAMALTVGIGGLIVKLTEDFEGKKKRKEIWTDWA